MVKTYGTKSKHMGHGQNVWDKVKAYGAKSKCDGTKSKCDGTKSNRIGQSVISRSKGKLKREDWTKTTVSTKIKTRSNPLVQQKVPKKMKKRYISS